MTRAFLLGLALLATACGSKKPDGGPSICTATVPPPAGCDDACSATPGSPNTCDPGFHCSADGKCDISCTQGGGQCGPGFVCTSDGSCLSDGTGSGDIPVDAADCPAVNVKTKRIVPTVALLLDQSGSMTARYPDNTQGNPRRWDALRTALIDPTNGVVKKLQGSVAFGATLYSGPDTGACPVLTPVEQKPRKLNNFTEIDNLLKAEPTQNTPTAPSIDAVVADFLVHPPEAGSPPIIVLATDGLPDTCDDRNPPANSARQEAANQTSVEAAKRAYAAGIRLFFLFIGDAEAGTHPKQMANAGAGKDPLTGNEVPFVATNSAALTEAFNTIIGGVVSCDLTLSETVAQEDAPEGKIKLNGTDLVYMTDWTLDADGKTLHLLGAACNTFKTTTNATVDGVFPCGTIFL